MTGTKLSKAQTDLNKFIDKQTKHTMTRKAQKKQQKKNRLKYYNFMHKNSRAWGMMRKGLYDTYMQLA